MITEKYSTKNLMIKWWIKDYEIYIVKNKALILAINKYMIRTSEVKNWYKKLCKED